MFLPPAVALLLVLGPMAMQNGSQPPARGAADTGAGPAPAAATAAERTEAPAESRRSPTLPKAPDPWQIGSTLVGILLLGGAGLVVLRQLRRNPAARGDAVVGLRQTLRLSARQAVHALEFEGRMLLVGEGERGLQLLHAGALPEHAADELEIANRSSPTDDEDDGAVPKNLVIPRPDPAAAAARPASRPATPGRAPARAQAGQPQTDARPATRTSGLPTLSDFRALLAKAGR